VAFFRSFGRNWFEYGKGGQTFHLGEDSLSGNEKNRLFRNDGAGGFTEVGWSLGVASKLDGRGFVPADFDRDGDLDFLVINDGQAWEYFENRIPDSGHWLGVQLRGQGANTRGIGARITITAGGRRQVREMHAGSGYLSSPPPEAHYGLADATRVERIEVRWPSGAVQVVDDVAADQVLVIEEGGEVHPLETQR
jgi:enediyne biosynthesis protein E4